jgi:UTP--glucose-1-phosphate uridylyltransferase
MGVRTALFPVGGLGTRFLPATKAVPKEMLPVVDKPLIQYAVEEARDAGIDNFVFITAHGKAAVENHFDRNMDLERFLTDRGRADLLNLARVDGTIPGRIAYVRQMEALGLGHAVWCARNLIGDELAELIDVHKETGGNVISVIEVPRDTTGSYGIITPGTEDGRLIEVKGLVEKPDPSDAPSNYAAIGRYVLEPRVMDLLGKGHQGAGGEIQLTDALAGLIGGAPFHAVVHTGRRFDCGNKVGFLEANIALALEREDLGSDVEAALRRLLG